MIKRGSCLKRIDDTVGEGKHTYHVAQKQLKRITLIVKQTNQKKKRNKLYTYLSTSDLRKQKAMLLSRPDLEGFKSLLLDCGQGRGLYQLCDEKGCAANPGWLPGCGECLVKP